MAFPVATVKDGVATFPECAGAPACPHEIDEKGGVCPDCSGALAWWFGGGGVRVPHEKLRPVHRCVGCGKFWKVNPS